MLSLVLRGPIFLVATIHRGWKSALAALFTESVFCVLTAGFYGAVVQSLRSAEPEWMTVIFLTVVMPALFQVLEYWLHWIRGTPHLRPAEFTSIVVSAISALFNWYAMRRGALLVGVEGRGFGADLRRLPSLALGFLVALPRKSIRRFRTGPSDFFRRAWEWRMPVKTLHLTNSWHQTSGGIATFYRALIEQANRRKQEIRLVVPGEEDRVEDCGEFGRIYHVRSPAARLNSAYRMIYPSQFLFAGSELQQILISERPDVVEICDKYTLNYLGALLRARLLSRIDFRPLVIGLSCERMDDNFHSYVGNLPFAKSFCSAYMRWLYFPFFDHHIANSDYTAAELRSAGRGHLVPRGTWIRHMGVDLQHLSPQRRSSMMRRRLLQNFGTAEDSVLLLYVGRLAPEKNLSLLFDLLEHLARRPERDFRLLVAGDGIERNRWEMEAAQRVPGKALFLGHIPDKNVLADLYANADLFVHSNPREPFGIAPLEAMASGVPLIAPNSGGIISYANAQNAWTVEPTVENFAAAIEQALADETLRNKRIQAALLTAQQYEWEKVAASFLDLYADLDRVRRLQTETLQAPAFCSTPASQARSGLVRGIAEVAERSFKFLSRTSSGSSLRKPKSGKLIRPTGFIRNSENPKARRA